MGCSRFKPPATPPAMDPGIRCHAMKANPTGYQWPKYQLMLSDEGLSRYGLLENLTTEKAIFEGVLDFNLQPYPLAWNRCHGIKANPAGYLWSHYECFPISKKLYHKCDAQAHGNVDNRGDYNSSMNFVQSS